MPKNERRDDAVLMICFNEISFISQADTPAGGDGRGSVGGMRGGRAPMCNQESGMLF